MDPAFIKFAAADGSLTEIEARWNERRGHQMGDVLGSPGIGVRRACGSRKEVPPGRPGPPNRAPVVFRLALPGASQKNITTDDSALSFLPKRAHHSHCYSPPSIAKIQTSVMLSKRTCRKSKLITTCLEISSARVAIGNQLNQS